MYLHVWAVILDRKYHTSVWLANRPMKISIFDRLYPFPLMNSYLVWQACAIASLIVIIIVIELTSLYLPHIWYPASCPVAYGLLGTGFEIYCAHSAFEILRFFSKRPPTTSSVARCSPNQHIDDGFASQHTAFMLAPVAKPSGYHAFFTSNTQCR